MQYLRFILLTIGITGFLASCECRSCAKMGAPSYQVCKGQGSQQAYEDMIGYYTAYGYECR